MQLIIVIQFYTLNIQLLIQTLHQTIKEQAAIISTLKERISILENNKNSNDSHLPPSQDQYCPKKNKSLREPNEKKHEEN